MEQREDEKARIIIEPEGKPNIQVELGQKADAGQISSKENIRRRLARKFVQGNESRKD